MPAVCSACVRADPKREHILEPAGFSTDLLEPPGADAEVVFVSGVSPFVSVPDADWVVLDNPDAGVCVPPPTASYSGLAGEAGGEGYAICLQCGRAEPEHGTSDVKASPLGAHRRLRRGREQLSCDAVPGNFAIQRVIRRGKGPRLRGDRRPKGTPSDDGVHDGFRPFSELRASCRVRTTTLYERLAAMTARLCCPVFLSRGHAKHSGSPMRGRTWISVVLGGASC